MLRKIRFYKNLLAEIIETLITICLVLTDLRGLTNTRYRGTLFDHVNALKEYSETLRKHDNKGDPSRFYK